MMGIFRFLVEGLRGVAGSLDGMIHCSASRHYGKEVRWDGEKCVGRSVTMRTSNERRRFRRTSEYFCRSCHIFYTPVFALFFFLFRVPGINLNGNMAIL